MTRVLDPNALYERALVGPTGDEELDEIELLVYSVKELETWNAMQGWDWFFMGSSAHFYPTLRRCLELISDSRSLAILDDYVGYLAARGVPVEPEAIERFRQQEVEAAPRPDWGGLFEAAAAERWQRLTSYLRGQGIELIEAPVAVPAAATALIAALTSTTTRCLFDAGGLQIYSCQLRTAESFDSPFWGNQGFACLLWSYGVAPTEPGARQLVGSLLRSGCRYFVCGGAACEAWHDLIDERFGLECANASDEERDQRQLMTSWHTGEAADDVAFFFVFNTDFDGVRISRFIVLHLGQSPDIAALDRAVAEHALKRVG
jgi:hypothetical protein